MAYSESPVTGACVYSNLTGESGEEYVYYELERGVTELTCLSFTEGGTDSNFFPYPPHNQWSHDYFVSPDECSNSIPIILSEDWTLYEIVLDVPSTKGKIIGNVGNDYLAIQLWTHFEDGCCLISNEDVVVCETQRGGGDGGPSCSPNYSICEPCRSGYYGGFSYTGTVSLAQFQLETGIEYTEHHKHSYTETLDKCRPYYEQIDCAYLSMLNIFGTQEPFNNTFRYTTNKLNNIQISLNVIDNIDTTACGTTTVSGVAINNIDDSSFTVNANCNGVGECLLEFEYEVDSDIYRLGENAPEMIV